jgi:hypothetical protein
VKNFTKIFEKSLDKKIFSAAAAFYLTNTRKNDIIPDGFFQTEKFFKMKKWLTKCQKCGKIRRIRLTRRNDRSDGNPQMKKSYSTQRIR